MFARTQSTPSDSKVEKRCRWSMLAEALDTVPARRAAFILRCAVSALLIGADHAPWSVVKVGLAGVFALYSASALLPEKVRKRVFPGPGAAVIMDTLLAAALVAMAAEDGQSASLFAPVLYFPILEAALVFPLITALAVTLLLAIALPVLSSWPGPLHFPSPLFYASMSGFALPGVILTSTVSRLGEVIVGQRERADSLQNDSARLKAVEERTHFLSKHDALTEVANREDFRAQLTGLLERSRAQKRSAALVILDIDNFTELNASHGSHKGDLLLKSAASRLSGCLRPVDFIGRLGSDEFGIALADTGQSQDANAAARRMLEEISRPFVLDGKDVSVTATAGVSVYPADGHEPEIIMRNAETALTRAQHQGSNSVQLYSPAMNGSPVERLALENDLRRALERDELTLYYQPQVNLETRRLIGMEALLRWRHPQLGLVSPAKFIPVAEESGLILPITDWVLRTACRQNKQWQEAGYAHARVAVNLSARQFEHKSVVASIRDALDESGLDPRWLDVEVTEGVALKDPEYTVTALRSLKEMGVEISMDDFGTGYSSLAYLMRFPFDTIKIDQSFVRSIGKESGSIAIVATIIDLARHLRRKVLAEGVETEDQMLALRARQCHQVQGYLISKPVPAQEITRQFQTRPTNGIQKYSRFGEVQESFFDMIVRYSYAMPPPRID